jgi:hypothetical protein
VEEEAHVFAVNYVQAGGGSGGGTLLPAGAAGPRVATSQRTAVACQLQHRDRVRRLSRLVGDLPFHVEPERNVVCRGIACADGVVYRSLYVGAAIGRASDGDRRQIKGVHQMSGLCLALARGSQHDDVAREPQPLRRDAGPLALQGVADIRGAPTERGRHAPPLFVHSALAEHMGHRCGAVG